MPLTSTRRISLRLELEIPDPGKEEIPPGQNPLVEDALELFDGKIVDVRQNESRKNRGK